MSKTTFSYAVLIFIIFQFLFFSCKPDNNKSGTNEKLKSEEIFNESIQGKKETVPEAKEVKLSPNEQKKLNVFFSNFSEVGLKTFKKGEITTEELINFGVYHNYRNNHKLFDSLGEGKLRLRDEYVVKSVQKFFGITLKEHKQFQDIRYKPGYYYIFESDGEAFTFSQVEKVIDIGKNQFIAYVNVYTANSGWTGDEQANSKEWEKDGDGKPEFSGKYKATYNKNVNSDGEVSYTLIEYIKK
jgi:hypothetical protein